MIDEKDVVKDGVEAAEVVKGDDLDRMGGAFKDSLVRTNKEIKRGRAASIVEDAEMRYKRTVEDLTTALKRLRREQENMLDLSPENMHTLMVAKDFDSANYVEMDLTLGVKIREATIRLEIAIQRYDYLFGGE